MSTARFNAEVLSIGHDHLIHLEYDGKVMSVPLSSDAEIRLNGKSATLDELDVGDQIHVEIEEPDGTEYIVRVDAQSRDLFET